MYISKPVRTAIRKRHPYAQPSLSVISAGEARVLLETYADRDDENARALLREAMIALAHRGELRERDGSDGIRVPQPSIFRRVVLAAVISILFVVPLTLLTTAVSEGSALQTVFVKTSLLWFPVWSTIMLLVTLDAPALFGFAGPRPDPFGPKALGMSALGIANIISMVIFLFVMKTR